MQTATVLLLMLAALYGGNNSLLKSVEGNAPVELTMLLLLALRFTGATVFMLPFVASKGRSAAAAAPAAIELGIWLWLGYSLQMLGLEKLTVATCSILFALCGVFVQFLELFFQGVPLSWKMMLSSIGALGGLWIFVNAPAAAGTGPPSDSFTGILATVSHKAIELFNQAFPGILDQFTSSRQLPHQQLLKDVPGEALVLAGTFFFAVHTWRCASVMSGGPASSKQMEDPAQVLNSTPAGRTDDFALALSAGQCFVAAVLSFLLSAADSPFSVQQQVTALAGLGQDTWLRILACGMLCTGLPHVLELWALRYVPPAQAALIYCTIPLWGAGFGIALLGEALSDQALTGGAIILMCSLMPSVVDILEEQRAANAATPVTPPALPPPSAATHLPTPATAAASVSVLATSNAASAAANAAKAASDLSELA